MNKATVGEPPEISVVIPTRFIGVHLDAALAAMVREEYPRKEILVVHRTAEPGPSRWTTKGVRFVSETRPGGVSGQRDRGVRESNGPVIAFLDDDIEVPPTYFRPLVALLTSSKEIGVVAGRMQDVTHAKDSLNKFSSWSRFHGDYRGGSPYEVQVLPTGTWLMKREAYLRAGGFDVDTPWSIAGEDFELSDRLREHGYRLMCDPSLVVDHRSPTTFAQFARRSFQSGIGYAYRWQGKRAPHKILAMSAGWTGTFLIRAVTLPRDRAEPWLILSFVPLALWQGLLGATGTLTAVLFSRFAARRRARPN